MELYIYIYEMYKWQAATYYEVLKSNYVIKSALLSTNSWLLRIHWQLGIGTYAGIYNHLRATIWDSQRQVQSFMCVPKM